MKSGNKNTTTPHPVGPSGFVCSFTAGWGGIDDCPEVGASIRKATSEISVSDRKGGKGRWGGEADVVNPEL